MFHWLGIASPNQFSVDECRVVLEQLYQVLYTYYTIHPLKVYNSMVLEYYIIFKNCIKHKICHFNHLKYTVQ